MQGYVGLSGPSEAILVIIPSFTFQRPRLGMTLRSVFVENKFLPRARARDIKGRLEVDSMSLHSPMHHRFDSFQDQSNLIDYFPLPPTCRSRTARQTSTALALIPTPLSHPSLKTQHASSASSPPKPLPSREMKLSSQKSSSRAKTTLSSPDPSKQHP
jgi:hypothetical protein